MLASVARPAGLLERLVPDPQLSTRWHVSPGVDLCAYAFSWLPIVVAMLTFGGEANPYAFVIFMTTTMVTDVHRHYTLPYIYLDREVRSRYPLRVWLLPALFVLCLTQTPEISRSERVLSVAQVGALLAGVWLTAQLMRQDRGGRFQLRSALPSALAPLCVAGLLVALGVPAVDPGWLWLLAASAASLLLHGSVRADPAPRVPGERRGTLVFPLGSLAILGAALAIPAGAAPVAVPSLVNVLFFVFLFWNGYHVILQKYGILRIYSAKSGRDEKVPGWVDRLLVWSWLPLWVVWIAKRETAQVLAHLQGDNPGLEAFFEPILSFCSDHTLLFMALASSLAVGSAASFLFYEWKVNRLQNAPRLGFALGTLLFYASFFPLGIAPFYSAYAFTHGIEYMVFTWAFQRRRYGSLREGAPLLSRWLRHPLLFYATYTALLSSVIFYARYTGVHFRTEAAYPEAFGVTLMEWIRWYTMYQAMLHFYYDGFLWKTRRPELRAQL